MALKSKMNLNQVNSYFDKLEKQVEKDFIRILKFVGEKAVNEARTNKKYQDLTGNLKNSVGYVIVNKGRVVAQNFNSSDFGNANVKGKRNGKKMGKALAMAVAKDYPDIALIVVAGMRYASYVESQGLNVLTSAEQIAKREVPRLLSELVNNF